MRFFESWRIEMLNHLEKLMKTRRNEEKKKGMKKLYDLKII